MCVCVYSAQGSIFYKIKYRVNKKIKKKKILDLAPIYLYLSLWLVPQIEYNISGSSVKSYIMKVETLQPYISSLCQIDEASAKEA